MSYGYYRAFNTMLDHVQVLHNMAVKAAKGNRFKELRKGKTAKYLVDKKGHISLTITQLIKPFTLFRF